MYVHDTHVHTYTTNKTHVHVHSTIRLYNSSLNAFLLFNMKDVKWQTVPWLKLKSFLRVFLSGTKWVDQSSVQFCVWEECFFSALQKECGNSLCFACLPIVFDVIISTNKSIVVVVTPLIALIKDQASEMLRKEMDQQQLQLPWNETEEPHWFEGQ